MIPFISIAEYNLLNEIDKNLYQPVYKFGKNKKELEIYIRIKENTMETENTDQVKLALRRAKRKKSWLNKNGYNDQHFFESADTPEKQRVRLLLFDSN